MHMCISHRFFKRTQHEGDSGKTESRKEKIECWVHVAPQNFHHTKAAGWTADMAHTSQKVRSLPVALTYAGSSLFLPDPLSAITLATHLNSTFSLLHILTGQN